MKKQKTNGSTDIRDGKDTQTDVENDFDHCKHRASPDAHTKGDAEQNQDTSYQDTHPTGKDDWKTRPPYRIHTDNDGFKARHKGSCHCGKVEYQLSREKPLATKFCHCTTCQKIHGCAYCRTPIMDEGRNMILLFPTLIDFKSEKDRQLFEPTCHMFYPQRVVDIPDGKTKWTGIDGKSDEMKNVD